MKTKLLITSSIILVGVAFFSFTHSGDGVSSHIAIVMSVTSKEENNEGYLIQYGDGTTELVPFEIGKFNSSQSALQCAGVGAKVMNKLFEKGYHFIGTANSANSAGAYTYPFMIFEKK
jgi:hypothetical protein